MFEISFTNPGPDALDYTAVGVLGHGLRPPTNAGLVTGDGITGVRILTDEAGPGLGRLRGAGAGHQFAGHQPPGASLSRPLVRRARGLLEGHLPAGSVPGARLRIERPGAGHGPQSRQQPRRRPRPRAAGRDPYRPLRHQLVRAQLPQVLGVAGVAFPAGVRGVRPVAQLVRDGVGRRRRGRTRDAGALGRRSTTRPPRSARPCMGRPCPTRPWTPRQRT